MAFSVDGFKGNDLPAARSLASEGQSLDIAICDIKCRYSERVVSQMPMYVHALMQNPDYQDASAIRLIEDDMRTETAPPHPVRHLSGIPSCGTVRGQCLQVLLQLCDIQPDLRNTEPHVPNSMMLAMSASAAAESL